MRSFIVALFFLSGLTGLLYEVIWVRQLTHLLGVSIYAVSAVLVAFMGGLGIGAELFGRVLNKGISPLRLYASMELMLGLYVLSTPVLMDVVEKLYVTLHSGMEGQSFYIISLRFLLAVTLLIIPTILMGGSLPALTKHFASTKSGVGSNSGLLYGINTIGAVVGCMVAGFWMIEHLGFSASLRVGAFINIGIGIAVWFVASEKSWRMPADALAGTLVEKETPAVELAGRRGLLMLFAIAGFCALALEVLWTRMLILLLNNTTYAFSLILSIFLLGIGSGSLFTSWMMRKGKTDYRLVFGYLQIGIGVLALFSLIWFAFNDFLIEIIAVFVSGDGLLSLILPGTDTMAPAFVFTFFVAFPATFFMGACFPLVVASYSTGSERSGGDIGRIYSINIVGCVLGSIIAGYILIPFAGLQKSIIAVAWLSLIAGSYICIKQLSRQKGFMLVSALVLPLLITGGLLIKGDIVYLLSKAKLDPGSTVEFYSEGPSATVLVSSQLSDLSAMRKPVRRLWINGDPIAGGFREALQLERLQAHIPLLLHPNPKTALVICSGTGTTAGAVASHKLQAVTVVDISPEVYKAGEHFSKVNFSVFKNRLVNNIVEDGRNFLLTSSKKYDFITSEPPPPSNAGIVNLYTVEYYELAKKRLNPNGIVTQWIPLHHLSQRDFKMLVASFVKVFPHVSMWYTKWDAILIGSNNEPLMDYAQVKKNMENPEVSKSLAEIGIVNPYQLLSNYMMGAEQLRKFVEGVEPLRDDKPLVEFTAPRILRQGVTIKGVNLNGLLNLRTKPRVHFASADGKEQFEKYFESEGEFLRGQVEMNDRRYSSAAVKYRSALAINPKNNDARYAMLRLNIMTLFSSMKQANAETALKMLDETALIDNEGSFTPQIHYLKGMFLYLQNNLGDAEKEFEEAISLDDNYFLAIVNLAGLYAFRLNEDEKAKDLYKQALKLEITSDERKSVLDAMSRIINK